MPELRRPVRLAWRRVTCGSSDHGLPALRDEPILGFRADEFHQWHASFHSPYQGPLSLTPEGEHGYPACSLFSQA